MVGGHGLSNGLSVLPLLGGLLSSKRGMSDCRHRPPCPTGTTRWVCCQRTEVERLVAEGAIERPRAMSLLAKYHVPISPPSRVYKGEPVNVLKQERLLP